MTNQTTPELHHQIKLEEAMFSAGAEDLQARIRDAKEYGTESGTHYGSRLLRHGIDAVTKHLDNWIEAGSGRPGRCHVAIKYLRLLDTQVAAYIGLKTVIDGLTSDRPLHTTLCVKIGTRVQDEVRFNKFRDENPSFYHMTERKIRENGRNDRTYKHTVMTLMSNRSGSGMRLWPEGHRHAIGETILDAIRSATGLVDFTKQGIGKGRVELVVEATEKTLEWVDKATDAMEMLSPQYWPMIVPPKPWTTPFSGGYYTPISNMTLVKTRNRAYLEELAEVDMPEVYNAATRAGETPWRVHTRVLDVLKTCMDRNLQVGKLPNQDQIPEPLKPNILITSEARTKALKEAVRGLKKAMGTDAFSDPQRPLSAPEIELQAWDEQHGEELRAWKKKAAEVHKLNRKLKSKRIQLNRVAKMAYQFSQYERIYFPYTYDFRGRLYPVPNFLNPQGNDVSKALLTFAEGKPITDENNGIFWLAVHGANTYGNDKCSLEDRETWTLAHSETIQSVAADPFGDAYEFWTEADKPWQFLAFCYEWADALAHGPGFISTLPVSVDGTCNGLQHYSAMLRDEVGGEAVNLLPADVPSDIYAEVAEVALDKVTDLVCLTCSEGGTEVQSTALRPLRWAVKAWQQNHKRRDGESLTDYWQRTREGCQEKVELDTAMARLWLQFGINRKITKRSVMTLPYSATQHASRGFIEDALREAIEKGKPNLFAFTEEVETEDGDVIEVENDGLFEASLWLQAIVWDAIGEVVTAAKEAMKFLSECAREVSKAGLPVNWRLPDGFYVEQRYFETACRRIRTVIDGQVLRPRLAYETENIDKRAMANGVAPNFVHSLDGCALRGYVNLAHYNGLRHFSLVHDSYGTVAADVEMMQRCIRTSFVDLYKDHDPLALLREDVAALVDSPEKLPPIPEKGNLDLEKVEESEFFFA